jgi:predicted permease
VYTVVGVAARGFSFPERVDVWLPAAPTAETKANPTFFLFGVFGKLRTGAKVETLQAELGTVASRLAKDLATEKPDLAGDYKLFAETLLANRVGDARDSYLVLLAAATLVLLIACTNLTSLLLARGWGRQREMALRGALGASPGRLRRQGLVESCLLGLLGGAAGIGVALGGVQIFRAIAPGETARLSEVSADWTLLWFALGSSVACGLLFGLAPASRGAQIAPSEVLKEGTRGGIARTSRLGSGLVIVEVALAFVLLVGATLMLQTLGHLLRQDPGFRTDHLLTCNLPQPPQQQGNGAEQRSARQIARLKEILAEVRGTPGVEDVVASDHGILNGMRFSHAGLQLEGAPPGNDAVVEGVVSRYLSPGYFRMLGIALLRGREFDERDTLGAPKVILVNEAMARKFWGTLDVVGKRLSFSKDEKNHPAWNEIVGVVANVRDLDIQSEADPEYFPALYQSSVDSHHLMVRTRGNPNALVDTISRRIWARYPEQPLTSVTTVARTVAESVGDQRMHTALLAIFAGVGLALALLGVYGVVSYAMERQTREIGVRMALGAGRSEVLRMVIWRGLILVAAGAAIGAVGALGAVRAIASELYGVRPGDPWTFCGGVVLILLVGSLACYIPARRAMRVDPVVALRYE